MITDAHFCYNLYDLVLSCDIGSLIFSIPLQLLYFLSTELLPLTNSARNKTHIVTQTGGKQELFRSIEMHSNEVVGLFFLGK